jgi:hypothetical protein
MISKEQTNQIAAFLGVKKDESVVLIGDDTTKDMIIEVYYTICDSTNACLINLDKYERPLESVPDDLAERVRGKDLCFYMIDKKADDKISEITFRRHLNSIVEEAGGRVGNMLSVTPAVIESAFALDADKVKRMTEYLHKYMQSVSTVRVSSMEGTEAVFHFDSDFYTSKWCCATGFIEKGVAMNVMPAEVFTHPPVVEGIIVITGTYGYLGSLPEFKDSEATLKRIKKNPIVWNVKNGRITDVTCGDKEIEAIVRMQVFEIENGDKIGEFGMGTNLGMRRCLGVMMHDEKYPAVHIAHGHGYPKQTGADYYACKIQYDGLLLKPNVFDLDRAKTIMMKGQYMI